MTKRILIITSSFAIGGISVSLNSLLNRIDTQKISVDVFALRNKGPYRSIYPNCRVLPENIWLSIGIYHRNIIIKLINYILRSVRKVASELHIDLTPYYCKRAGKCMNSYDYDAVISFHENLVSRIAFIPAKKRISWVHSDYSNYLILNNYQDESNYYALVDKIVCVSEYTRNKFIECTSIENSKVIAIHNIINEDYIRKQASIISGLDANYDHSSFTIVSVGRFDAVKQFDLIPWIASEIRKNTQKPFKWYIIGGTIGTIEIENQIRERIKEFGIEEVVTCLPAKVNVYPYIACADLFVSTSKSEAFPLVVQEAKSLFVPPVINNFGSAPESVRNEVDGFIIPLHQMPQRIASFIDYPDSLIECIAHLKRSQYDNDSIMNSIYKLI